MRYVFGVNKTSSNPKKQRGKGSYRKHHFCYEFDVESCKFRRIRISFIKAIYYKITFVFGLKARKISNIKCQDCKKYHYSIVNFWDNNRDCPYC
tara:strand:- start:55 stop:336 length:282 start_codon:yes stop_codon:yes gene_type:complete